MAADRVPADVGHPRCEHRAVAHRAVQERGGAAGVGEAPRAPAVEARHDRDARVRANADRAERDADAGRAADLVLVEARDERLPVGLQRELPLAVLADPHDRNVDRRLLARRPRARDARLQPGRGRVGAAADVAADDADSGPDGRDDALADARDCNAGDREQRRDDEKDRDVLGRRLAAVAHDRYRPRRSDSRPTRGDAMRWGRRGDAMRWRRRGDAMRWRRRGDAMRWRRRGDAMWWRRRGDAMWWGPRGDAMRWG